MLRKFLLILSFAYFALAADVWAGMLGSTGKISGKVTDGSTSEAIIGANIQVLGTSMGAASNANGEFVILNVPPGTYTIKATYIGYNDYSVENVRVYVDLTSDVNIVMNEKSIQTQEVVVRAVAPLVNKNITNSNTVTKAEDIQNLPVRGVNNIVATAAGVVSQGGMLYVRGSRADAVQFMVDGVSVTNPLFGGNNTSIINNAIEEIQFQAGGYTAEYGGANAGIVSTSLKTGSERYAFSFEAITDNFVGKNSNREMLGGYSYGYSEYVMTAGGPLVPGNNKFRFFVAGSYDFLRSPIRFWEGAEFKGIYDPTVSQFNVNGMKNDTIDIVYPKGYMLNAARSQYRIQGNVTADLNPIILKLGGTYYQYTGRSGVGITDVLAAKRAPLEEGYTGTGNLKLTHLLTPSTFYELQVNYYGSFDVTMDPDLKHNIAGYGDSIQNAKYGYTLLYDGQNLPEYQYYGETFLRPDAQLSIYQKIRMDNLGGKLNFVHQIGKIHELKTGFEMNYYTIRRYAFTSAFSLANYAANNPTSPMEQWYRRLDNYGYDLIGNKIDDDNSMYAPKHPVMGAFYIQDKMEFSDLIINAGLRLDYIDTKSKNFKNPSNIKFDERGIVAPGELVEVDPVTTLSPRLAFSFPVTDVTVFHAQYGKFVQQTRLRDIYLGWVQSSDNIKGGYAIGSPVGFGLRPERTTTYELGFRQQLGQNFAFDITGFYKDIKDQVQMRRITASAGAQHGSYYAWLNGDFSTTRGFELKLDLRRTERLAMTFSYTYSDARGTGSNPSTGFRAIWQSPTATPFLPQNVSPLDFNQTHRGSLNLDYRFEENDGPSVLSNSGLNLLFTFNSGHNFTLVDGYGNGRVPQEALNSSTTPWNFQLDARLDKSFSLGPIRTNVYLLVVNVLNTKNVVDVFAQTGSTNNGYLATEEGRSRIDGYKETGQEYADNYQKVYNAVNNDNEDIYGNPRQIRLGVKLDF